MPRLPVAMVMAMSVLSPATALCEPPARTSNAVPYRVSVPVATGREGTATVASRALMNRDGTTTVEIATAPFDFGPTDAITHLLFKALTPSGDVAFARTYNDTIPNGYVALTFSDLVREQVLQLQAHVDDRLNPRTDVVSVTDVVRRRPDVRVTAIAAPAQAATNVPVVLTATLDEHNGDVGTYASCVLLVDGAEVDWIVGVWIDAGDTVSCAFTHRFDTSGSHTIRVAAIDVNPADWDTSNNALGQAIGVTAPFQQYYVAAGESTETQSFFNSYSNRYNTNPVFGEDILKSFSLTGWAQGVNVQGWVRRRWAFPVATIDAMAADEIGTRFSAHMLDLAATSVENFPNFQSACGSRTDGTSDRSVYVYVCSAHDDFYGDYSYLFLQQYAGSVTYTSLAYDRFWSGDPGNILGYGYYQNTTTTTGTGTLIPYGSAVEVAVAVTSGETTDGIDVTVPLPGPSITRSDSPLACGVDTFSWVSISWCTEYHDVRMNRGGVVTAGSWP